MTKSPRFARLPAPARRAALIAAALDCMAKGGITAFTVDPVCTKAQVSRSRITHHFNGSGGLLTAGCINISTQAIPNAAYFPIGRARLTALINALFDPAQFNQPR